MINVTRVGQDDDLKIIIDNKPIMDKVVTGIPNGVSEIEV